MSSSDEVRVVFHEECEDQHADVHSVIIGIGCYDDVLVAEVLHVVLQTESVDEKVELFVFCNPLAAFLVAVDWLSPEREYRLCLCIACLGDGSARRVSLGDEYACLLGKVLLCCRQLVVVVELAVAELAVVDVCPLVPLLCLLLDAGNLLAFLFGRYDLLLKHRRYLLVHVEVVVEVGLYEVVDERPDGRAFPVFDVSFIVLLVLFPHVCGAELGLGLAFKVRLLDLDADCSDDSLPDVFRRVVLFEELLQGLGNRLSQGGKMCTSLAGVLSVYEG